MRSIADQYRILEQRPGWLDRQQRGWLRIEGGDAVPFLHALVTNDVERLTPGTGIYAAYLTPQGRMIADLEVLHRGAYLLAGVARPVSAALAARLDQSVFAEDVQITEVSDAFATMLVAGSRAASAIGDALGADVHVLDSLQELSQADAGRGFVMRSGDAPVDIFDVVVPREDEDVTRRALEGAGAWAIDASFADALRIAAGRPAFGVDMTAETIPLEAGLLERAISTTKGCYVGQEIIIRVLHRGGGRVAKRLVRLSWTDGSAVLPAAGTPLVAEQQAVGHLTSAAPALSGEGYSGLAYVARDRAVVGQVVHVGDADGPAAEVTGFAG